MFDTVHFEYCFFFPSAIRDVETKINKQNYNCISYLDAKVVKAQYW